jgi:hypothetical protein
MSRRSISAAMLAILAACESSVEPDANDSAANVSADRAAGAGNATAAADKVPAPIAMTRFVNVPENALSDRLRRNYVDFSFEHPSNWTITPQRTDGSANNYVRVAAPLINGYEPFAFHVGSASGGDDPASARGTLEQLLPQLAEQFGGTLPDYRIVSIGEDNVGPYDSLTWRFSATAPGGPGIAAARIYGRGDIVLPPDATKGVLLITLATDRTDEVGSPAEVGESGTLRAVFDSLRVESSGGNKPS